MMNRKEDRKTITGEILEKPRGWPVAPPSDPDPWDEILSSLDKTKKSKQESRHVASVERHDDSREKRLMGPLDESDPEDWGLNPHYKGI